MASPSADAPTIHPKRPPSSMSRHAPYSCKAVHNLNIASKYYSASTVYATKHAAYFFNITCNEPSIWSTCSRTASASSNNVTIAARQDKIANLDKASTHQFQSNLKP